VSNPSITTKAYEEKINAQLQQVKSQLEEFEARAKGKMAPAEIETINQLKAKQQELEKKRQDLKTASDSKIEEVKAQIEPELAKLKTSLEQLATKFKKAS
jgi:DNA repair exonuclease SbcCD ATPase subunit